MRSLQIALISLVFTSFTCFAQRGGGGHGGGGGGFHGGGGGGSRAVGGGGFRGGSVGGGYRGGAVGGARGADMAAATDIVADTDMDADIMAGSDSDLGTAIPTMAAITDIRTHMDTHTTVAVIIPILTTPIPPIRIPDAYGPDPTALSCSMARRNSSSTGNSLMDRRRIHNKAIRLRNKTAIRLLGKTAIHRRSRTAIPRLRRRTDRSLTLRPAALLPRPITTSPMASGIASGIRYSVGKQLALVKAQAIVALLDLAIAPQIPIRILRREMRRMLNDYQGSAASSRAAIESSYSLDISYGGSRNAMSARALPKPSRFYW